jgi:hypothetical protein
VSPPSCVSPRAVVSLRLPDRPQLLAGQGPLRTSLKRPCRCAVAGHLSGMRFPVRRRVGQVGGLGRGSRLCRIFLLYANSYDYSQKIDSPNTGSGVTALSPPCLGPAECRVAGSGWKPQSGVARAGEPMMGWGNTVAEGNRVSGLSSHVVRDTVIAQVEIQAVPRRLVSLLSRETTDEFGLESGGRRLPPLRPPASASRSPKTS